MFLDRDGVLNRNILYPDTGAWESPRTLRDFRMVDDIVPALTRLHAAGYLLFLVSNQPNEAKGKSPGGTVVAMHGVLADALQRASLSFTDSFYCMHHPDYTGACLCRKPSPYFLLDAARRYQLALAACWMIGDRTTDMACGNAAGVSTAWIRTGQEMHNPDSSSVDVAVANLTDAVSGILARVR